MDLELSTSEPGCIEPMKIETHSHNFEAQTFTIESKLPFYNEQPLATSLSSGQEEAED